MRTLPTYLSISLSKRNFCHFLWATETLDHHCVENGCGQSFYTFPELRKHLESDHPTTLLCPICERSVDSVCSFRSHVKRHHIVRTTFPCEQCEKEFSSRSNLRLHVSAVHDALKPFVCMVGPCSEAFAYKSSLQRHLKNVHGKSKADIEVLAPNAKRAKKIELGVDPEPLDGEQTNEEEEVEEEEEQEEEENSVNHSYSDLSIERQDVAPPPSHPLPATLSSCDFSSQLLPGEAIHSSTDLAPEDLLTSSQF